MMDPMGLWKQWYETSAAMWSNVFEAGRENYADPYKVYQQWFDSLEGFQQMFGAMSWPSLMAGSNSLTAVSNGRPAMAANPATEPAAQNPGAALKPASDAVAGQAAEVRNLWNQWFQASQESWQKSIALGQEAVELTPRWIGTLDQIRNNLLSAEGYPTDPLQLSTRLYNATNGPISDFLGDLLEREEILDVSSQFLQNYASFSKVFRRNSEEYLKNLSLPVRSDITRVAGLVLALEEKIDNLEDGFEDFEDGQAASQAASGNAESLASIEEHITSLENKLESISNSADASPEAATADAVGSLEKRLDNVEGKIDQILAALERSGQNGAARTEAQREDADPQAETAQAGGSEIRATAAAERKAQELGIELSEVEGTGTDGQVSIDDVRKKGAS